MASSQIFCPIRKAWVAALPEEIVRQKLISHMVSALDFPISYLVIEAGLRQMPHLQLQDLEIPKRRTDLICFGKEIHPKHALYPLLLVECKAIKITKRVINQVVGYNRVLGAYYVAVANDQEIRTGWFDRDKGEYVFVDHLPGYRELLAAFRS